MHECFKLVGHEPVPCDMSEIDWQQNRVVAKTKVGKVEISTMFLPINHQFGDGPPLVFETMIFGGKHDEYQRRYATWSEAEAGHEVAVKLVKQTSGYRHS